MQDEQMCFLNKNRKITNYIYNSRYKKFKLSEQEEKKRKDKTSYNKGEIKKQKVKKYKIFKKKFKTGCWHLKTKCFIYHIVKYVTTKYFQKSNYGPFFSFIIQAKKQLYFGIIAIYHHKSKTQPGQVCLVQSCSYNSYVTPVTLNFSATNYFFNNQNLLSTYTK